MISHKPCPQCLSQKRFSWILDVGLKIEIIQAWQEFQQDPEVWRLNHYWSLVYSVPIVEDLDSQIFDNSEYGVRFGDSHQPSLADRW